MAGITSEVTHFPDGRVAMSQRHFNKWQAKISALQSELAEMDRLALEAIHQRNKTAREANPEEVHALRNLWNAVQIRARAAATEANQ